MESNTFFVSWALWQQMTFVLGAAITAVFLAGVVKLWWITRLLKKQEVIDEEKKARVEDMRRSGIPPKRANDIPFGIRAIQSGVEVVGIWISRPDSPNHATPPKGAASVTIINLDSEKGTESSADDIKNVPASNTATTMTPATHGTPQPADTQLAQSPPRSAPRQQQGGGDTNMMLSEDTLRKLEGQSHHQQQQPYVRMSAPVPPSSTNNHHHQHPRHHHLSQRSSESSASASGESMDSQSRSYSGRSYTDSSRTSSKLYMAGSRNFRGGGGGDRATYNGLPQLVGWQLEENYNTNSMNSSSSRGDPFGTRSNSGSRFSHQGEVVTPEPTFGPGEVARVARRVNAGFEVLPAGTFAALRRLEDGGVPGGSVDGGEGEEGRGQRKLRKKSVGPGTIQENGGAGTGQVVG
ncbi:hypothetical protein QBC39DRAFT_376778 [Podospora conica]|nr:hypothetical protein QBC39DRAFT_376778 [Schizothecium conicum]